MWLRHNVLHRGMERFARAGTEGRGATVCRTAAKVQDLLANCLKRDGSCL